MTRSKAPKGLKLKLARVTKNISLAIMAEKAGVSPGMLSLIERDLRRASPNVAKRIAKAYGVRPRDVPGFIR